MDGLLLQVHKRGKLCTIAKLVKAKPLGVLVLAMPYRNRQRVNTVSVPPAILAFARGQGARFWVVRFDLLNECYALPLSDVERCGWLRQSQGGPEWFVPLVRFERIAWQDWPYVERAATWDMSQAKPLQLALGL